MTKYSEKDMILPALDIIARNPGIFTAELIVELEQLLKPSGNDLVILAGRNDSKFSQKVRNLVSHHTIDQAGLNYIKSVQEGRNWYHTITQEGRNYLEAHIDELPIRNNIGDIENQTFYVDDSLEVPPPDIIAYNELRSCADLFRLYRQNMLVIQPEFQREIVWNGPAQTRFIDSLIKQLPIPSMCFSLDFKVQKWQVIDGLQRMFTIIKYLSGESWTLSKLEDIDPRISGKHTSEFMDENNELHELYTRVENLTLPITVLRCDYSKKSHTSYLFTIFHRLNSGGMKLNNQEIRNCIYSGSFNLLLKDLNKNNIWMKINKMKQEEGYRFTKQELILRLFAFHDEYRIYGGRLVKFLNEYMDKNKNLDPIGLENKRQLFLHTIEIIFRKVFEGRIPQKLSISMLEALLVGVSLNIDYLDRQPPDVLKTYFSQLQKNEEFSDEKLREGLSGKPRVIGRLSAAEEIFSGAA